MNKTCYFFHIFKSKIYSKSFKLVSLNSYSFSENYVFLEQVYFKVPLLFQASSTHLWSLVLFAPLSFTSCSLSVTLSGSLQMDVVSAFQSGTSFQGALRRQASNSSQQQQHDVTNVSSPSHVAFSTTTTTAANSASATVGCECVFSYRA